VEDFKKEGKTGTPVNPEMFAVWQARKRKARAEAAVKKVEAELKKKKGGKGLSVLSGRDLYEYKRELFSKVDDEDDGAAMQLPLRHWSSSLLAVSDYDDDNNDANGDDGGVEQVAEKVQSDLFLQGDDDDLDDIDDD
jgi:hypothetical protein